jgi:murein DD-endopeptidase MepM/ murein hydrolase activator NlpD
MNGKYYTFVIFPGAHGKLLKIHLPAYIVELILGFALAGVAALGALANSYAHMLLKVSRFNTLRAEREALQIHCRNLQGAVTKANEKLVSMQSLAADVALAYGFSDGRRPHLPGDVLRVASRGVTGADYNASLWAFHRMQATPLLVSYRPAVSPAAVDNPYVDSATPSIWPVRGQFTAGFGQRMDPFSGEAGFHTGVDIAAPAGTPVRAAADGLLFCAGPEQGYGNEALIDHGFGITTKYAHLNTLKVVVGEKVARGQIIGSVGMTGRATGPHLHYEVLVHGTPVNPLPYMGE